METDASADLGSTAHTSVECVVCVGRKRRAERSCLECLESYCEPHLELHNTLHVGKRHKLVEPSASLQERICPQHHRLLEVYCRTDQQCICHVCITDQHRTHDVLSMEDVVAEMQTKVEKMQSGTNKRIQRREKEEEHLREAFEMFKKSAEGALLENECLFTDLIHSMEERQRGVKELITAQKEMVVRQVEELLQRLQREMSDLQRRRAELEQLQHISNTHHHTHFIQKASSVLCPAEGIQMPPLLQRPHCSFELVINAVSELMKKLHLICQWKFMAISERVRSTGVVSSPLPRTRQDFLKYACKLTVDLNTVHDYLHVSEDGGTVKAVRESECRPPHADQFQRRQQALCREGLRGAPHYWEVECGSRGSWVCIAVSYKGIRRTGKQAALFGRCPNSWALRKYGFSCEFWHNNKEESVMKPSRCSRVGVYLDHGAGLLAFYNATDMSLIHLVRTQFTEPLYAGFGLTGIGAQVKICNLDTTEDTPTRSKIFSFSKIQ